MLHMISARCVARDLHTIAPRPHDCTFWKQFAAQRGDCKKSRIAPLSAILLLLLQVEYLFRMVGFPPADIMYRDAGLCDGNVHTVFINRRTGV